MKGRMATINRGQGSKMTEKQQTVRCCCLTSSFQVSASLLHLPLFTLAISDFSHCQLLSNNHRNPEKKLGKQTKAPQLKQKMRKTPSIDKNA